jgi:hypothetical protein
MKFIRKYYNFILENKEQAKKILKELGESTKNDSYVKIKDELYKTFNKLTYLGLFTQYHFKQDVSLDELFDLIIWLKENSKRLPVNPLKYERYENLKDDIILIDNDRRIKHIYNLLLSFQKEFINIDTDEDFKSRAIEIQKLGLFKSFGEELKAKKTRNELIEYMSHFIDSNSSKITFETVKKTINDTGSKIIFINEDETMLLAEVFDYDASKKLGSANWCISTGSSSWESYTKGLRRQFFLWDFSKYRTDSLFQIGFTVDESGKPIYIHDKFDKSLKTNIPSFIFDLLEEIDFKVDLNDIKEKIIKNIELLNVKPIYSTDNIFVIKVESNEVYNRLKQNNHYISYNDKGVFYMVFNFEEEKFNRNFYSLININETDNGLYINIKDYYDVLELSEFNKSTNEYKYLNKDFEFIKDFIDILEYYNIEKEDSLNKNKILDAIEPYAKNETKIDSIEFVNISTDPNSLGELWLFKIKDWYGYSKLGLSDYNFDIKKVDTNNHYILINIDTDFNSNDFIKSIRIKEGSITIKHSNKSERNTSDDVIDKLIQDKFIIPKTSKDYNKDYNIAKQNLIDDIKRSYQNELVEEYGKVLYEWLLENDNIDDESETLNYFDEEENYKNYVIPMDYDHYGLTQFYLYTTNLITSSGDISYAIGDDEEADDAAYEYMKQLIEEIGYGNNISYYIDGEDFASDYSDYDYYYDLVSEEPESYDISKELKGSIANEIKKLEELIDEIEYEDDSDDIENLLNIISKNNDLIDEYTSYSSTDLDDYDTDEEKFNLIHEEILQELKDKKEELEEDEDSYEYDESEIEERAEELDEDNKKEIADDPVEYLKNMGFDEKAIADKISSYIDTDEYIKDVINNDGRGNSLSSYDGNENEINYNDKWYYIYRTN